MPAPADGSYRLTWTVPGTPPSVQSVTYVVKGGKIETTFGRLTWDEAESIFTHPTLMIGLECTGTSEFVGTAPGVNIAGTCQKLP